MAEVAIPLSWLKCSNCSGSLEGASSAQILKPNEIICPKCGVRLQLFCAGGGGGSTTVSKRYGDCNLSK